MADIEAMFSQVQIPEEKRLAAIPLVAEWKFGRSARRIPHDKACVWGHIFSLVFFLRIEKDSYLCRF
jgi:hypothetical protein